jgi:hypothetical protein
MKKIILILAAFAAITVSYAQTSPEEVDLIQAAFGMEKRALVSDYITLDGPQKDAFWALYDEYEIARKELGKVRIDLWTLYAQNYSTFTPEEAEAWVQDVMKLQTTTDKLIRTYYGKIRKSVSPVAAVQFFQLENYIITAVRMELQDNMPFFKEN